MDAKLMESLFLNELGCTVYLAENVSSFKLQSELEKFKENCKTSSFLVVVILTHGGACQRSLLMDDMKENNVFNDVVCPFNDENFVEFKGKPKIFLIQATTVAREQNTSNVGLSSPPGGLADIFVGLSCLPCWNEPYDFSLYIRAIKRVFTSYQTTEDLETMHDRVREEVLMPFLAFREQPSLPRITEMTFNFGNFKFPSK